ncbi:MAG: hypothetical protein AAF602_21685 [Myxococcota bacterium]
MPLRSTFPSRTASTAEPRDCRYLVDLDGDYDLTGSPDDPDALTATIACTVDEE